MSEGLRPRKADGRHVRPKAGRLKAQEEWSRRFFNETLKAGKQQCPPTIISFSLNWRVSAYLAKGSRHYGACRMEYEPYPQAACQTHPEEQLAKCLTTLWPVKWTGKRNHQFALHGVE